jgi:Uma2 family endonuclease
MGHGRGSRDETVDTRGARPILVVEVLSDTTRRRDVHQKRRFYLEVVGVPEYWIVDPDSRTIRVARLARPDLVTDAELSWRPDGAANPLTIPVSALFEP